MPLVVDTGVLFASMDRRDAHHAACAALIERTRRPLIIAAPVLAEVDYFIRTRLDQSAHLAFLDALTIEASLKVADLDQDDYLRIRDLCVKYADMDLGLVDASVVAIAERLNEPKIATLDHHHFRAIRPRHVDAFELLPR